MTVFIRGPLTLGILPIWHHSIYRGRPDARLSSDAPYSSGYYRPPSGRSIADGQKARKLHVGAGQVPFVVRLEHHGADICRSPAAMSARRKRLPFRSDMSSIMILSCLLEVAFGTARSRLDALLVPS